MCERKEIHIYHHGGKGKSGRRHNRPKSLAEVPIVVAIDVAVVLWEVIVMFALMAWQPLKPKVKRRIDRFKRKLAFKCELFAHKVLVSFGRLLFRLSKQS